MYYSMGIYTKNTLPIGKGVIFLLPNLVGFLQIYNKSRNLDGL
jgi:hypothetical protein